MNLRKLIREELDDFSWTKDGINESDELDWIRDIEPRNPGEFRIGDVIFAGIDKENGKPNYVMEVVNLFEDDAVGEILMSYKILESIDEDNEPVGLIQDIKLDEAYALIEEGYWENQEDNPN